ncbi:MAG: ATPase [Oscillospiraceae bacterium]
MMVDEILDMMDDILDEASAVPFNAKKSVIDSEKMRNCINDLRLNLPKEMSDARHIVLDRKEIVKDANKEAEQIIRRAEERAKVIASDDEITKTAQKQAAEILNQAQAKAKELKAATNKYVESMLMQSEEVLQSSLAEIRKTRQAVRTTPTTTPVKK